MKKNDIIIYRKKETIIKFILLITILISSACSSFNKKEKSDYITPLYLIQVQEDYNDRNLYIKQIIQASKNKNYLLGLEQYISPSKLNNNTFNLQDTFDKDLSALWYSFILFNATLKTVLDSENLMPHEISVLKNKIDEAKINYIFAILKNKDIFSEIKKINFLRNKKLIIFQESLKSFHELNMADKAPEMIYRSVLWNDHLLFLEHSYLALKQLMNSDLPQMISFQNRATAQFVADPTNEMKIENFVNDIFIPWRKEGLFISIENLIKKSKNNRQEIMLLINHSFYEDVKKFLIQIEKNKNIDLKFHNKKT